MRMAEIPNTGTSNAGKDGVQKLSLNAAGDTKWQSRLGKVWQVLTKVSILLSHNLAIKFLHIYSKLLSTKKPAHRGQCWGVVG